MNVLVIGGSGTIGTHVVSELRSRHNVLIVGRNQGDFTVDITDSDAIQTLFEQTPPLDAVVVIAGEAVWKPFEALSEEDYYIGFRSKLMGQVNVTRLALEALNDGGSITLSTGVLADDPVKLTASAAMVNGAIHSFVKAAALEMPRGIRLNAVSAGLVEDSLEKYQSYFPGHTAIPMNRVVNGYLRSIEGHGTGQIIRIYDLPS